MLHILHGADDYSATQELDAIRQTGGDPSLLTTNTSTLEGGQVTIDELRVACETVPFLADKRLVIIHRLLERFAPRQARGTPARKAALPPDPTPYAAVFNNMPPSTILVLLEDNLAQSNPLFKLVARNATAKAFPLLRPPELREWIDARVAKEGSTISPGAITMLARLVGGDLWTMSGEITKLTLYCLGRRIEEKDVKALVSNIQETSVFTMVDAIVENNIHRAQESLQQLLTEGGTPPQLLTMLNRQMRLIVRAKDLRRQGVSEAEMQGRLGVSSPFQVRKALDQAKAYTMPRIKQVYEQLLQTDVAIKTGKYDGELALHILVAELCQPLRR